MTNPNIPTAEEIRKIIGSLNSNPDKEIKQIQDYFKFRPYELEHLTDERLRKSFILRLYLHYNTLSWWVKADQEVKSLETEKNELID